MVNSVTGTDIFKIAVLRPATLLKTRLQYRCFSVKLSTFLRTELFLQNTCGGLLFLGTGIHGDTKFFERSAVLRGLVEIIHGWIVFLGHLKN